MNAAADADTASSEPVEAAGADAASHSDLTRRRDFPAASQSTAGVGDLCGWPLPAAPTARETEVGFEGGSVWYSANGSAWMQHANLTTLLAGMAAGMVQAAVEDREPVCVAVHLPPQWFPCADSPAGCELAVWVRPGSTDVALLNHAFNKRAFSFLRPSLLPRFRPAAILDAGANIGLASLVFAMRFPDALIVAVEPAPNNFALLQRNLKHLPQILPVNAALWSHDSRIAVTIGIRGGFWGYETVPCGHQQARGEQQAGRELQEGGKQQDEVDERQQQQQQQQQQISSSTVNPLSPASPGAAKLPPASPSPCMAAVSVPSLLQRLHLLRFDFAKIDIEGAELQVFSPSALASAVRRDRDDGGLGGASGGMARGGQGGNGGGGGGGGGEAGGEAGGWHRDVAVLSMEEHEDKAPGIGVRMKEVFPRARYDVRKYGENTVYFNPRLGVRATAPIVSLFRLIWPWKG
ncbi:unnamed protein product [Closterium sp. Naga37s-1]|nr:unnamed protein product [Closterium sp. Naga37s-1]